MNISHYPSVGNNSRVAPVNFSSSCTILDSAGLHDAGSTQELLQKPQSHKTTKSQATRLVNIPHDHKNQSSSEFYRSKTITVLISFAKLSKYDDALLKLGKQLLLLKKSTNKQQRYEAALACFKSAIKNHRDNYVAYYFSGITLCLLGRGFARNWLCSEGYKKRYKV